MAIDLGSSRILFRRAREEAERFKSLQGELFWSFEKWQSADGEFVWGIRVRQDLVHEASLSLWITATLAVSALDHAIFALWLSCGGGEENEAKKVCFPWSVDEQKHLSSCDKLPTSIRSLTRELSVMVREEFRERLIYVDAMRKIANTGKHRQIVKARQSILAVKVAVNGASPVIWNTPQHDPDGMEAVALHSSPVDQVVERKAVVLKPNLDGYSIELPDEDTGYLEYVQHDHSNIFETAFAFTDFVLAQLDNT